MNWSPQVVDIPESALGVFSYSLNEIKILPDWAYRCSKLLILEPSLQHTARPLQELRKPLLDSGFHLWAPCTHHEDCPLLLHSKSDWCHTRIHVDSPESVAELERHLPMKNRTLTYSYLLVAKHPRPEWSADKARVIGDTLYEKGKIRQFICRNSEREYLSWLKRHGEPEPLERGSLVELPPHRKMANELRVQAKD